MGSRRRQFTREFKQEALELAESLGNMAEAARDLGIAENSIYRWRAQAEMEKSGKRSKQSRKSHKDEEIRRLERENKKLRAERDFLKKAAAFFAQQESTGTDA